MDQHSTQVYMDRWRAHLMAELRRLQKSLGERPSDEFPYTPPSTNGRSSPVCKSEPRSPGRWAVMAPRTKVAVFGATGRSASSIIEGLLESPTDFNMSYRSRGIHVLPYDLKRPNQDALISILRNFDVVISALGLDAILDQIPLATMVKAAGVGRFVPTMYATCTPAVGVEDVREMKEEVLNHVKKIGLTYTVIDVGCWYEGYIFGLRSSQPQCAPPTLPFGGNVIPGTGDVPTAITSFRDVGRWVAQIVEDPRTLNKMVFAYGSVLTANQAFDVVERLTGGKGDRNYISGDHLLTTIFEARTAMKRGEACEMTLNKLHSAQSLYSYGFRGDNTPWNAKFLGYLDARELYPEFRTISFEEFTGKGSTPVGKEKANEEGDREGVEVLLSGQTNTDTSYHMLRPVDLLSERRMRHSNDSLITPSSMA
ncbi:hypothetical protein SLS57_009348 [Botryosphaeria dothidea]